MVHQPSGPLTPIERAVWRVIIQSVKEGSTREEVFRDAMAMAATVGVPEDRVKELVDKGLKA